MPFTKIQVRTYMLDNIEDHVDILTGEVNATALAEDACSHFEAWIGDDVPERFFDLAETVATQHEIKTGIARSRFSSEWSLQ